MEKRLNKVLVALLISAVAVPVNAGFADTAKQYAGTALDTTKQYAGTALNAGKTAGKKVVEFATDHPYASCGLGLAATAYGLKKAYDWYTGKSTDGDKKAVTTSDEKPAVDSTQNEITKLTAMLQTAQNLMSLVVNATGNPDSDRIRNFAKGLHIDETIVNAFVTPGFKSSTIKTQQKKALVDAIQNKINQINDDLETAQAKAANDKAVAEKEETASTFSKAKQAFSSIKSRFVGNDSRTEESNKEETSENKELVSNDDKAKEAGYLTKAWNNKYIRYGVGVPAAALVAYAIANYFGYAPTFDGIKQNVASYIFKAETTPAEQPEAERTFDELNTTL